MGDLRAVCGKVDNMYTERVLLKQNAKKIITDKNSKAIIVSVVLALILLVLGLLAMNLSGYAEFSRAYLDLVTAGNIYLPRWPEVKSVAWLLAAAIMLMRKIVEVGYMSHCMAAARGQETGVRDLMNGMQFVIKITVMTVIETVLVTIGFALFIVPGVVIMYKFKMAYYIMLDNPEFGAVKCLSMSSKMAKGYKIDMFILDLSFIGWHILNQFVAAMIVAPVVAVWLNPYMGMTWALYYGRISGQKAASVLEDGRDDTIDY